MPAGFHEVQYLAGWGILLFVGVGLLLPAAGLIFAQYLARRGDHRQAIVVRVVAGLLLTMMAAFLAFAGKMTTEVTATEVRVRFGWLTSYSETIPVADIQEAQAVQYDPLDEYGGWGIRGRGQNRALNQLGNEGVRLQLPGGKTLLIGSQRPRELADAIALARQEP